MRLNKKTLDSFSKTKKTDYKLVKFSLTIPPSVNHIYGRTRYGQVYLRPEAKDWLEASLWSIKRLGHIQPITDPVSINIDLFTWRTRDLDNILKLTLDFIAKHAQILQNDSQVFQLHLTKTMVKKDEQKMDVEIKELGGEEES